MSLDDSHQSDALDVFGCPLAGIQLIEASAGTGKTWNICGLYLRLLLEKRLTVQQILVVTFTNAATAELRERVRSRIVDTLAGLRTPPVPGQGDPFVADLLAGQRARPGASDEAMALLLDQALQTFDEAAIFTIHGFCQRALADTPFTANMPLVQDLLQDDRLLRLEVVHDFWRLNVAGEAANPALVAHLLARGDTPERYARLLQRQLAKPLSQSVWPAGIDAPADVSAEAPALTAAVAAAFGNARALWSAGSEAITTTLIDGLKQLNGTVYKKDGVLTAGLGWHTLFASGLPPASTATLPPKLALYANATLQQRAKKDQSPPSHPFFDAAQALLDALGALDQALGLARLRLLRKLLTDGAARLRQAKRARRVVAFDDMLFNLHDRLSGGQAPGLAAALLARFPAALIDEFQDTDPLQFAVFQAIYDGPAPGNEVGTAAAPLFLVGDPKQAIYSFRHADLHTYLRARALAAARYTLLANQRATLPLITALNRLFGQQPWAFMQPGLHYQAVAKGAKPQPRLHDISHEAPSTASELPSAASDPTSAASGAAGNGQGSAPLARRAALQVWTLPSHAQNGQPLFKAEASAAAADTCAGEITRLLTEAAAGRITLGDRPFDRPLRAGDIAVLVRSHAQGSVMRQALALLGVGSVELSQASIFRSPDAEELERVLAAMLQPNREGLLKAALATRWLGLDAAQIEALAGDEPRLMATLQRFADHHALWRSRGIGFMLRHWLHAEQVAERLLAAPDGPRRLTNLLHLAESLHQAAAEHPSPEALHRWLQAQRDDERGDDATQLRLESDRNLVQIVTVHKSKGLEYPVVFCPFLWDGRLRAGSDGLDGIARRDDGGNALIDYRAGFDDDVDEAGAKAEARLEAAAEFMRLVYVALTRAVQRCYLVAGSYRNKAGKGSSSAESGRSLLNWLVADPALSPSAWLDAKRKPAAPQAIDAAWQALAIDQPGSAGGADAETKPDSDTAADAIADASPARPMAVGPLPKPWRTPLPAPRGDGSALQALPPPARLGEPWWIGSYSALAYGAGPAASSIADGPLVVAAGLADERAATDRATTDHDLRVESIGSRGPGDVDEAADTGPSGGSSLPANPGRGAALAPDDILGFPRGPQAGECVHAAFEWAEFTDPTTWPLAIDRALQAHPPAGGASPGQPGRHAAMLQRLLGDVLGRPLPVGTALPLRLATVPPQRRLAELEFHLHAPHLTAGDLNQALAALGYELPALGFGTLRGYLKGFIDLVFEHDGRYFIADWKSNDLGEAASDYAEAPMAAVMSAQHYHLQSLIYSVALHRWLGQRLPGYRCEQHFGGALYLFVRGLRPGWCTASGAPAGLHFHRPTPAAINRLSALLAGPAGPAGAP